MIAIPITRRFHSRLAVGGVTGIALLLGGCGSTASTVRNESANQVVASANAAMNSANSVTIAGHFKATGLVGMGAVHLRLAKDGDMAGEVMLGRETVGIIQVGSNDYMEAPPEYLKSLGFSSTSATGAAGKWVEVAPPSAGAQRHSLLSALIAGLTRSLGTLTKVGIRKVQGQEAVGIRSSAQDAVLWFSASSSPLLVEASGRNIDLVFTAWNSTQSPRAPAHPLSSSVLKPGPPP